MKTFKQFITEVYQEEPGGSVTHDGARYDLNKLLQAADGSPIAYFKVSDLEWVLTELSDKERVQQADLNAPLLVTEWHGRWVILDGEHRLRKALKEKTIFLPGKVVDAEELEAARIQRK